MKTINHYLSDIISLVDDNPELTLEVLLEENAAALGLDESNINELKESFALIDSFSAKHNELKAVREAGGSRADFMVGQIEQMAGKHSIEEQDALLSAVNKVSESIAHEIINQ